MSQNTVGAVREDLEGRFQIENVSERTDTLGRRQPATKPRVYADSAKQAAQLGEMVEAVDDLPAKRIEAKRFDRMVAPAAS